MPSFEHHEAHGGRDAITPTMPSRPPCRRSSLPPRQAPNNNSHSQATAAKTHANSHRREATSPSTRQPPSPAAHECQWQTELVQVRLFLSRGPETLRGESPRPALAGRLEVLRGGPASWGPSSAAIGQGRPLKGVSSSIWVRSWISVTLWAHQDTHKRSKGVPGSLGRYQQACLTQHVSPSCPAAASCPGPSSGVWRSRSRE